MQPINNCRSVPSCVSTHSSLCCSSTVYHSLVLLRRAQGFRRFVLELQRQGFKVLITSRCQLGCGLQGAEQLHLDSLLPQHAANLLRREAGAARATGLQAEKLAHICNSNALALTIIGGFIASHAVTAEVRTGLMCVE